MLACGVCQPQNPQVERIFFLDLFLAENRIRFHQHRCPLHPSCRAHNITMSGKSSSLPRPKLHRSGSLGNLDIQKILCGECSNESDEEFGPREKQCTLRCMHNMIVFTRAQQYKNSREGMLLIRGGKDYREEKSSLLRQPYGGREKSVRRMLEMI